MEKVLRWGQGNPGAISFLVELFTVTSTNLENAQVIENKLQVCTSIRGTNIWVLYSDLCNKNIDLVAKLCKECPDNILEDACSRQDYSGRILVAEYLK